MTHPGDRPNDDRSQRAQLALARLLPKLFRGGQAFVGVEASLSGLDAQTATRVPDRLPHSVLDLLAHINWWNRWMLDTIEMGQAQPYPAHAADTWPTHGEDDWGRIKNEFYELLARIDAHAARPDLANPVNHEETIGELLADFALHTAHHFGQIVTVRQALGAWPPPAGGDTW
ncbi:metal-dependent hydrolase [Deinococcus radiopugnans]|uniref:Metal-dependent hydrolase n=1 Tax=Deinococcus radiopugnans TaxID=57497 RepID=A0A0A7KFY2_9DEIO|nr:DinB family protein [Deinococcus radiopugnans]AIZ45005.1 metal-dependent hydrolase [Deinococcus radiopugnans]